MEHQLRLPEIRLLPLHGIAKSLHVASLAVKSVALDPLLGVEVAATYVSRLNVHGEMALELRCVQHSVIGAMVVKLVGNMGVRIAVRSEELPHLLARNRAVVIHVYVAESSRHRVVLLAHRFSDLPHHRGHKLVKLVQDRIWRWCRCPLRLRRLRAFRVVGLMRFIDVLRKVVLELSVWNRTRIGVVNATTTALDDG